MNTKVKSALLFSVSVLLIGILAYLGAFGVKSIGGYHIKSFGQAINRGLDLQGGVSVVEQIQNTDKKSAKDLKDLQQETVDMLSARVNSLGVSETSVTAEGSDKVRIEIPGKYDTQEVLNTVAKTGKLRFLGPDGTTEILTGSDVKKATAGYDQNGQIVINLQMNASGTTKFRDATQKYLNQNISINLDEKQLTNPTVNAVISDGSAVITGEKTLESARNIANLIQSGALPVDLKTVTAKNVSATLGAEALPKSVLAGAVGVALIFLFMIILYRGAGAMADIALVLFIVLVLLTYSIVQVTLTLAGIAAFLLTIGMAVDANVLMFERIKEELKNGKSVKTSIQTGYKKALSSILDSNITTMIAGIVLYSFGTGSVKGFALTLLIGIFVSLFTAIVVTRFLMKQAINMGLLAKVSHFGVKRG